MICLCRPVKSLYLVGKCMCLVGLDITKSDVEEGGTVSGIDVEDVTLQV